MSRAVGDDGFFESEEKAITILGDLVQQTRPVALYKQVDRGPRATRQTHGTHLT